MSISSREFGARRASTAGESKRSMSLGKVSIARETVSIMPSNFLHLDQAAASLVVENAGFLVAIGLVAIQFEKSVANVSCDSVGESSSELLILWLWADDDLCGVAKLPR
jgi:hypothetical protein